MFWRRWRQLRGDLNDIRTTLDQLERHTDKLQTVLMVREPSSVAAGDAYEGLRKQVVAAVSERMAHLAQLVELHSALAHGADAATLRRLADSWLEQAGVARIDDPAHPQGEELYELVTDEDGPVEVWEPAYVDVPTGRLIRPGRARRRPVAPDAAPADTQLGDTQLGDTQLGDRQPEDPQLGDTQPAGAEQAEPETTRTER